jgi:hypothetical protein
MLNSDCNAALNNWRIPEPARALGLTRGFIYTGPSMLPTFRSGQMLYVHTAPRNLQPGDVIVFAHPITRGYVTHRIIAATPAGFITRGDRNARADTERVALKQIVGRVEMLEERGRVKPVRNGKRALRIAQVRWRARQIETWTRIVIGAPYRALRASAIARRILARLISLRFEYISIQTTQGTLVKTIHHGRVIARYWQHTGNFECCKPYDLILAPPDSP